MKTYVKPDFSMTRFSANEAFADCNSVLDTSVTTYEAQELSCLVSGNKESVFSSGVYGCTSTVNGTTSLMYTYNGTEYFLWYDSSVVGGNNPSTTLLDEVCAAAGVTSYDGKGTYSGWHIAKPTGTITDYYTNS